MLEVLMASVTDNAVVMVETGIDYGISCLGSRIVGLANRLERCEWLGTQDMP